MPLAERVAGPARGAVNAPSPVRGALTGWGGGSPVTAEIMTPVAVAELQAAVAGLRRGCAGPGPGAIARGMGRSYGDAAQLGGGLVLDTTALRTFELDPARATVTAQAGVTLGRLLAALQPAGWVLPVVPGTQHVTVGGAIASDIHGKNHGSVGTFGSHVRELGLLTASGELLELSPEHDGDLFRATLGGMGLTGVIVWARVALTPLRSAALTVDIDRVQSLDDALAALLAPGGPHRVAWLDLLGPRLVRAVVTRAEQVVQAAGEAAAAKTTVATRLTVPRGWPGALLQPAVVRAYNDYRYRRTPRRAVGHIEAFGTHMFPLDVLNAWPRLYGRRGFVQYQLVVPRGRERELEALIGRLRRSPVPCYLAVLKDFGPANGAPLSFPIAGWTLAMDLPRAVPGLEALLASFDEIVAAAGGRVYLAKDASLRPETLAAMYPRLGEWRAVRDRLDPERVWRSDLAVRTGLIGSER